MSDADELVGLPLTGPTSLDLVKLQLAITDTRDDERIGQAVGAVNSLVRTWRCAEAAVDQGTWPARIELGATILAGRFFRRKNSPAGVEAMGSQGAVYVMRNDPDVAQLLQMGTHSYPTVG
jgi:hypothetical protein